MRLRGNQLNDLKLGDRGEKCFIDWFSKAYDDKIKKTKNKFEEYDFDIYDDKGKKTGYWELKTRRIASDTYTSLMFGLNKLEKLEQHQKDLNVRVYFLCYDKLCYWECDDIRGKQNKEWFIKKNVYIPDRGTYGDCVCVKKEYIQDEEDCKIASRFLMSGKELKNAEDKINKVVLWNRKRLEEKRKREEEIINCLFSSDEE